MATSLLLACGLNEQKIDNFIHISEESGVDGNFIISSILGQRLRIQTSGVILVCLQQTYQHYLNAGLRLGYNLKMFEDKNLRVIEPIKEIANDFMKSKWTTAFSNDRNNVHNFDEYSNRIIEILLSQIENSIEDILKTKTSVNIIIDNLSILINFGSSEKSILRFYHKLQRMAIDKPFGSIITKLNNSEIYEILNTNLITLSDLHLNVMKLKSGNFKEVDGRLIINRNCLINDSPYEISRAEKNILFKVNDRNIKIFNLGEIGVK